MHNLADAAREARLRVDADTLSSLLDTETVRADRGVCRVSLEPYGYRWYRIGDMNQPLARETVG